MRAEPDPRASIDELREAFRKWLRERGAELEAFRSERPGDLAACFDHFRPLQRMLFASG